MWYTDPDTRQWCERCRTFVMMLYTQAEYRTWLDRGLCHDCQKGVPQMGWIAHNVEEFDETLLSLMHDKIQELSGSELYDLCVKMWGTNAAVKLALEAEQLMIERRMDLEPPDQF
jgi:hypothetical protein